MLMLISCQFRPKSIVNYCYIAKLSNFQVNRKNKTRNLILSIRFEKPHKMRRICRDKFFIFFRGVIILQKVSKLIIDSLSLIVRLIVLFARNWFTCTGPINRFEYDHSC